jgi:hypothetical protein
MTVSCLHWNRGITRGRKFLAQEQARIRIPQGQIDELFAPGARGEFGERALGEPFRINNIKKSLLRRRQSRDATTVEARSSTHGGHLMDFCWEKC